MKWRVAILIAPDDVDAAVDNPIPHFLMDFFLSFPNAKWILTTRPSRAWAESRFREHPDALIPVQEPCGQKLYSLNSSTHIDKLPRLFDLHNELVTCMVPPENLFEINVWNSTDGVMEKLAKFLNIELSDPKVAYPTQLDKDLVDKAGLGSCSNPQFSSHWCDLR